MEHFNNQRSVSAFAITQTTLIIIVWGPLQTQYITRCFNIIHHP